MNQEFPDVKAGYRKGRRTRDQIVSIHWIIEKAREFQKNIYFCFIDNVKAFDCGSQQTVEILKEMGISDHLTYLLRNLYAGQEATVRTRHGTTVSKLGKEYIKATFCHPAYLTSVQNARLNDSQAEIKIAGRNINNLRYADDTKLMTESKEELKRLLMKEKEKEILA